jgi:zinc transporter 7
MVASRNAIIAALSSTTLISLAPNVLLFLFPHYASGEGANSSVLALGQALAAGGLLGDVFLHTIPHAAAEGGDSVGLWILLGFSIFLVTDMLIRSLGGGGGGHSHAHHKDNHNHNDNSDSDSHKKTSTVWLNLAADAMHNFTDGLAIGAAFSISSTTTEDASVLSLMQSRGGLATLSILFHEIPHELGDFAILVKNGFSKNQAILAQFGTAIAALLGTVVGIALEGFLVGGDSLMLITAGGFVYLAAVTILPEILEDDSASSRFRVAQTLCFATGIGFLYMVTILEEMGGGHSHSHGHHEHAHHHEPIQHDQHHQHHGHEHDHHAHGHHQEL